MDKRAAVRVPVRVRAQCRTQGVVIDGLVEDVSRSGLFMRVPRSVHIGSTAEVTIDLPEQESVQIAAEVVRVDEPRSGMGLRFVGDSDHSRRPLANFIMRQHATSR